MRQRTLLGGLAALPLAGTAAAAASPARWPARFLWGTATAGHQVDGGNLNSDYWVLEHARPTRFKESSGDACDSWNRWAADIALLKQLGCNAYRFSLEWARIEPAPGEWSQAALDHYRRFCAALREAGIMPVATYHHFTSPAWIAGQGGWESADTADRFARYAERTTKAIGDLIGAACTLNEPNAQVNSWVLRGFKPDPTDGPILAAAARAIGSERFHAYFMGDSLRVRDVCIAAHTKGGAAIRAAAPGLKVGITLALQDLLPGPGGERLYRDIFANGRKPFYEAARNDDFIGIQTYMRFRTGPDGYLPPRPGQPINMENMEVPPDALGAVAREAWRETGVPIFVTENGIQTTDEGLRERHVAGAIASLRAAMADGVPVLGYMHWSLMDNFEWEQGYGPKFGLYAVDRQSFARTPKPAAALYRRLIRTAGVRPVAGRL